MTNGRHLTTNVKVRIDADTKAWIEQHAARMDRSEGSIVRLALRDYRAKVSRRKDG